MNQEILDLDQHIAQAERIGVIGSPSSTAEITLDILGSAVIRKLVGELALFSFTQDNKPHYALGQITEVTLRNVWHEDPTIRSLIRQRGHVDAISERQDTHQGEMVVSAVFTREGNAYRPSILGTVPATGTVVSLVDDETLHLLLRPYHNQLFYLGYVYGSTPKLPLWFKHFDKGVAGAGEAYHLGIFGKTGSGKSVLAKMILLAYARYPAMGIIVLDPQGEFAKDLRGEPTGTMQLHMPEILRRLNKRFEVVGVRDLVLDRWELFIQILIESRFFQQLTIPQGENRQLAAQEVVDRLKRSRVRLKDLHKRETFDKAWEILGDENVQRVFYRSGSSRDRFQRAYAQANPDEFYERYWRPVTWLFKDDREGARRIDRLLQEMTNPTNDTRPLLVVDLSQEQMTSVAPREESEELPLLSSTSGGDANEENTEDEAPIFWNDKIQRLIIKRFIWGIREAAERLFRNGRSMNTLVLIDEAHRLAPSGRLDREEEEALRDLLKDAVRTTRKGGVGWMFISQTLASIDREILNQLRIFFFGFGLGMGQEFRVLSELVGGRKAALDLYQLFRDPHSSFDATAREYSFMTTGPVSPLSFSGTPLFFNAFNAVEEFLEANQWEPIVERET